MSRLICLADRPWIYDRRMVGWALAGLVIGFLVFGWWPFMPFPKNRAEWLPDRGGLAFKAPSMAYTEGALETASAVDGSGSFTLEITLQAADEPRNDVGNIVTILDSTGWKLALVQWKHHLVLRARDETVPRGFRETSIPILSAGTEHRVTLTYGSGGITWYADGKTALRVATFSLPPGGLSGRLILGAGPSGKNSWAGRLYSLVIYHRVSERPQIARRHFEWAARLPNVPDTQNAIVVYTFGERGGQFARDSSGGANDLLVPHRFHVLHRTWLSWRPPGSFGTLVRNTDVGLNIVGFVPFGAVFLQYLRLVRPGFPRSLLPVAVGVAGMLISFVIEIGQIWLPIRVSSLLDLACNTGGAMFGGLAASFIGARDSAAKNC